MRAQNTQSGKKRFIVWKERETETKRQCESIGEERKEDGGALRKKVRENREGERNRQRERVGVADRLYLEHLAQVVTLSGP